MPINTCISTILHALVRVHSIVGFIKASSLSIPYLHQYLLSPTRTRRGPLGLGHIISHSAYLCGPSPHLYYSQLLRHTITGAQGRHGRHSAVGFRLAFNYDTNRRQPDSGHSDSSPECFHKTFHASPIQLTPLLNGAKPSLQTPLAWNLRFLGPFPSTVITSPLRKVVRSTVASAGEPSVAFLATGWPRPRLRVPTVHPPLAI